VTAARVILVSDTHLAASAPRAQANWDAVLGYVRATGPDLVIHLGDLSQDGARGAADLRYGRAQLGRLPVPWRAVAGNHDVGDNPRPGAPEGSAVDGARHQRWLDIVGPGHWSVAIGGWTPALVISGHVHQYRMLTLGRTDHLWVPTAWAVIPDHAQPVLGVKRCGIVSLTLAAPAPAEQALVEPGGLEQLILTVNEPDPYRG
jgi:3',5'-cyclic AMP phosphodiesterase CpdA